jgi:hypothetical protein
VNALALADVAQLGGVLVFAYVVWAAVKEQTVVLKQLSETMMRIAERQNVIMDRQRLVAESLLALERGKDSDVIEDKLFKID